MSLPPARWKLQRDKQKKGGTTPSQPTHRAHLLYVLREKKNDLIIKIKLKIDLGMKKPTSKNPL